MVEKTLINYIKKSLKEGYSEQSIKNRLAQAGYSQYDIQEAFQKASKKQINIQPLLIIFGILLVGIIIVIIALSITSKPPAELILNVQTYKTQVSPGEEVIFNANIMNPSGRTTETLVDATIKGRQVIYIPSQTVIVREQASVPITAQIPQGAEEGQYDAEITISYDGKQKRRTQTFEVAKLEFPTKTEELTESERVEQKIAVCRDCDDLDLCTDDECIQGKCVHTQIIPCCGNGVCEAGETNCRDCQTDAYTEIEQTAKNNPEQALQMCKTSENVDICIKKTAIASVRKMYCEHIQDSELRDACYITFAYTGDFTVCEKIENKYTRNSCYTMKNIAKYES